MFIQKDYLKKDETVVTAKVESIELPLERPILGILLNYMFTTGAAEAAAAVNEVVVEVIKNGSEVIISAQMGELIAYYLSSKYRKFQVADLGASASAQYIIPVMFGRHWMDDEYFLNPAGFVSLDLKVTQPTHTATTTRTWDVILFRLFDSALSPKGHFKISTKKAYTAAAAVEYVSLDRAYPYGELIVSEMDGASTDIATIISNLKLNIDAGGRVPFNQAGADLQYENYLVRDGDRAAVIPNVLTENNFLALDLMHPWMGEEMLIKAPDFGSLVLELTGSAAGTIRVTGVELVR